jgi:transposase
MNVRYRVTLDASEKSQLEALVSGGTGRVRQLKRAQILLAAHAGASDEQMARTIRVGSATVYRVKRRFVEGGVEHALYERQRPGASRKLTGKQEALLVATACSTPPKGRARWTLRLLADELVRLTEHEGLSRETVRRRLEENELKPWQQRMWCIPKVDAEYVARMEVVFLGQATEVLVQLLEVFAWLNPSAPTVLALEHLVGIIDREQCFSAQVEIVTPRRSSP